jgi:hypothetical protein
VADQTTFVFHTVTRCFKELRNCKMIGPTLSGDNDELFEFAKSVLEIVPPTGYHHASVDPKWDPQCRDCAEFCIYLLIHPINKLVETATNQSTFLLRTKRLKEKLYGDATADTAMAIDNEPTVEPKLLKKLISDEVKVAVRAAVKNDKRPTKAGKKTQPRNNNRTTGKKDESDDDASTTATSKTSKRNNKKKASPANTITPTKETQIFSGKDDRGARAGASSKKKNARSDDEESQDDDNNASPAAKKGRKQKARPSSKRSRPKSGKKKAD